MTHPRHRPIALPESCPDLSNAWSPRRKFLVILAATAAAWVVWGGVGYLIWRALRPYGRRSQVKSSGTIRVWLRVHATAWAK